MDAGVEVVSVTIAVFLCVACRATWRVLPGFLARWLHRPWSAIEAALQDDREPTVATALGSAPVPKRTTQRWRARLRSSARLPLQALAAAGGPLRTLVASLGLEASRQSLVLALRQPLASAAALLHRVEPGLRLM